MFQLEFWITVNGDSHSYVFRFEHWPTVQEVAKTLRSKITGEILNAWGQTDPGERWLEDYAREVVQRGLPDLPSEAKPQSAKVWGRMIRGKPEFCISATWLA